MTRRGPHIATAEGWGMDLPVNSPPHIVISDLQRGINEDSFVADHPNTAPRSRSNKSPTPRPPRRPTPEEFCEMVYLPHQHESRLAEYVGTDSKYTMAANHASLMVRAASKALDMSARMSAVAQSLAAIDCFLKYLLEYKDMKPEQRGCVSLRISFGALTALMGDFSQGEIPESDPNAPAVPREYLPTFRKYNTALTRLVVCLSEKLETSINMYRHRRSPSNSLVTKFEEMLRTLSVWNEMLSDDTFRGPTNVITHWLNSHPQQVHNKRQVLARSQQTSPNIEANPSPSHLDSSTFLSPQTAYNLPSPTRGTHNVRSPNGRGGLYAATGTDQPGLFDATGPGVTYFSSSLTAGVGSTPFPNDELSTMYAPGTMFQSPGHGSSQGPYPNSQSYSYH